MIDISEEYALDKLDQRVYAGDTIFYAIVDNRDPILRRALVLEVVPVSEPGRPYVTQKMKIQPLREVDEEGGVLRPRLIDVGGRDLARRRFIKF